MLESVQPFSIAIWLVLSFVAAILVLRRQASRLQNSTTIYRTKPNRPEPNFIRVNVATGEHVLFCVSDKSLKLTQHKESSLFDISTFPRSDPLCPFCPGQEAKCPAAFFSYDRQGHLHCDKKSGTFCVERIGVRAVESKQFLPEESVSASGQISDLWVLRVVPNKFPVVTSREGNTVPEHGALQYPAIGEHMVIVETEKHNTCIALEPLAYTVNIVRAFLECGLTFATDKRFKHLVMFKNHGPRSGGSLIHSHCQVVAVPFVPQADLALLRYALHKWKRHGKCQWCRLLDQELYDSEREDSRVVYSNKHFLLTVPFAAPYDFYLLIMPKIHDHDFLSLASSPERLSAFAQVLRYGFIAMYEGAAKPSMNFLIRTAPLRKSSNYAEISKCYHWHVELVPRMFATSGFELGSGIKVNWTMPEVAAKHFREVVAKAIASDKAATQELS